MVFTLFIEINNLLASPYVAMMYKRKLTGLENF